MFFVMIALKLLKFGQWGFIRTNRFFILHFRQPERLGYVCKKIFLKTNIRVDFSNNRVVLANIRVKSTAP